MAISTYLSVITLNIYITGLYSPIKRHRVAEWIKKKTDLYAVYKRLTLDVRTHRLKVKGWNSPCKWKPKESWSRYTYIRQNRL